MKLRLVCINCPIIVRFDDIVVEILIVKFVCICIDIYLSPKWVTWKQIKLNIQTNNKLNYLFFTYYLEDKDVIETLRQKQLIKKVGSKI